MHNNATNTRQKAQGDDSPVTDGTKRHMSQFVYQSANQGSPDVQKPLRALHGLVVLWLAFPAECERWYAAE